MSLDSIKTSYSSDACVDYEADWLRHRDEIKRLTDENEQLKNTIIGMCMELFKKGGAE